MCCKFGVHFIIDLIYSLITFCPFYPAMITMTSHKSTKLELLIKALYSCLCAKVLRRNCSLVKAGGNTMTHDRCASRPSHRYQIILPGNIGTCVREQLAQGCIRKRVDRESNPRLVDRKSSAVTTRPPSHAVSYTKYHCSALKIRPGLNSTIALWHANSAGSTCRTLNRVVTSCRMRMSECA